MKKQKKKQQRHECSQAAKQCIRRGTKVFCSSYFQLQHNFLETADTVKVLTAVIYRQLFLLVNLFTSEILTNAGAKPRKSTMSYYCVFYVEETTLSVSPRIGDIATINTVHSPCKSTDINMAIPCAYLSESVLAEHRSSAKQVRTTFGRSVELQKAQVSLDRCPRTMCSLRIQT